MPLPRRKAKGGPLSPLTTHVLDTARGQPAVGLAVQLEMRGASGRFESLGRGVTDANGRITDLLPAGHLKRGVYRLTFATAAYFSRSKLESFFPSVSILFEVREPRDHYHVPLLLSPFGYSTYRGS